ncbi:MAG: hypothetical protein JNL98_32155 [Bryobacterales bacterium]|nr:hypothetical protein [Bryobacterales bacterium]
MAWQPLGFHAIWLTVVVGLATWGLLHTKPGKRIARVRVEMMSGTRWEDVWEAR